MRIGPDIASSSDMHMRLKINGNGIYFALIGSEVTISARIVVQAPVIAKILDIHFQTVSHGSIQ